MRIMDISKLNFKNMKIRNQVLLLFLVLIANASVIILVLLLWLNGYIYNNVLESVRDMNDLLKANIEERLELNESVAYQTVNYMEKTGLISQYLAAEIGDKEGSQYMTIIPSITRDVVPNLVYSYGYYAPTKSNVYLFDTINEKYHVITKNYQLDSLKIQEPLYTEVQQDGDSGYYAYIYPYREEGEVVGYYVSVYNLKTVTDAVTQILNDKNATLSMFQENQLIYNTHKSPMLYDELETFFQQDKDFFVNGSSGRFFVQVGRLEQTNWRYVVYTRKIKLYLDIIFMVAIFAILTAISATVGVSFFISIKRSIARPIDDMVEQLESINDYNEHREIQVDVNNEISRIGFYINEMMDKIHRANEEVIQTQSQLYEMELARAEAELSYYQSQINPHFLYNNLEFIRSLGAIYAIDEVEKIAVAMSHIFRYSIKADNIVTLGDELGCMESYFSIMNLRFPGKYEIGIHIPGEHLAFGVPKMILQPIVENAFKHGFVRGRSKGTLKISGSIDDHLYYIDVVDTGVGISKEKVDAINKRLLHEDYVTHMENNKKIGLDNINNRLRIQYGKGSGIHVESREGHYTKVQIRIAIT